MAVRAFGHFRELIHGSPDGPSIHDHVGKGNPEIREQLAAYLEQGAIYAVASSFVDDVLSEERIEIGRLATLTDGSWLWPTDLAYYVRVHNVSVPAELVERAASLAWTPPEVTPEQVIAIRDEILGGRA